MSKANFQPVRRRSISNPQTHGEHGEYSGSAYELEDRTASPPRFYDANEQGHDPLSEETLSVTSRAKQAFVGNSDERGTYQKVDTQRQFSYMQRQRRLSLWYIWWRELLCCVLFVGALLTLVATLRPYQGQPIPKWPYHLSINTLVSVYIVILKAAMVFVAAEGLGQLKWQWFNSERPLKDLLRYDDATRGPWGSLKLLFSLRFRQLASSFGAFIILAAIIVDPFAQQIIATFNCQRPAQSFSAFVPRTNRYNESGPHIGAGQGRVSLGIQNSINAGIFSPGKAIDFVCPTGNCTFPPAYHTVGFCGNCSDTTNQIMIASKANPDNFSTAWQIPLLSNSSYGALSTNTTAVINGSTEDSGGSAYFVINSAGSESDIVLAYGGPNLNTSSCGSCSTFDLFNETAAQECKDSLDKIHWGCGYLDNTTLFIQPGYGVGAARCSLNPCVRTYTSRSDAGYLDERLVSVASEWSWSTDAGAETSTMVNIPCLGAKDRLSLADAGYKFEGKEFIPYVLVDPTSPGGDNPLANQSIDINKAGNVSRDCVYEFDAIAQESIEMFLGTYLSGNITPGTEPYDYRGSAQLQAIYNESTLPFEFLNRTWQNLAESLTNYIRQHGVPGRSDPASGTVFREETCIRVRWPWIAYPAILVLSSLIFFTATVLQTSRGDARSQNWKSNPLPLVLTRLDSKRAIGGVKRIGEEVLKKKEMEDLAAKISVRLDGVGDAFRFLQTRDDSVGNLRDASGGYQTSGQDEPSSSRPRFRSFRKPFSVG